MKNLESMICQNYGTGEISVGSIIYKAQPINSIICIKKQSIPVYCGSCWA
jgi:hypothetical protein